MKRRRLLLGSLMLVAVVLVTTLVALTDTSPRSARALAIKNADWLLTNYMEEPSGIGSYVRNTWRKVVALRTQYALAAAFRKEHAVAADLPDDERVMQTLLALRPAMLNQAQLEHPASQWISMLSGVGVCDQMNGMAATVLGGMFPKSEIFALRDSITKNEHTIGRVYSERERTWLYYDLWASPTVFRLDETGRPTAMRVVRIADGLDSATQRIVRRLYDFTSVGYPFVDYPSSYRGFLFSRATRSVTRSSLASVKPAAGLALPSAYGSKNQPPPLSLSADFRRRFAEAQLEQLLGDRTKAAAMFTQLARSDSSSILGRASATFAARR